MAVTFTPVSPIDRACLGLLLCLSPRSLRRGILRREWRRPGKKRRLADEIINSLRSHLVEVEDKVEFTYILEERI